MLETDLRNFILADAAIAALITSNNKARIYPVLVPQEPTYPLLRYQRIDGSGYEPQTQDGSSGQPDALIRIEAWSTDYEEAADLEDRVIKLLDAFRGKMGSSIVSNTHVAGPRDDYAEVVPTPFIRQAEVSFWIIES